MEVYYIHFTTAPEGPYTHMVLSEYQKTRAVAQRAAARRKKVDPD